MTKAKLNQWLSAALQMEAEKPRYKLGGDGTGGMCDCIGLAIGALRRCGVEWSGIHGSNWAARNECVHLRPITDSPRVGSLVLKSKRPTDSGYALPARYAASPDRLDYYHVGIVLCAQPLVILHCSSGGVQRDTKRGQWAWCAELKQVDYGTSSAETDAKNQPDIATDPEPVLRRGARGEAVQRMQTLLLTHGQTLPCYGTDGKFGTETLRALKAFQTQRSLKADGICGVQTWSALKGDTI